MTMKQRKSEKVIFRVTAEQKRLIKQAAQKAAKDEGQFVRDLVLQEIGRLFTEAA